MNRGAYAARLTHEALDRAAFIQQEKDKLGIAKKLKEERKGKREQSLSDDPPFPWERSK